MSAAMPSVRAYVERHDGFAHVKMNVFLLAVGVILTPYERQLLQRTFTPVPPMTMPKDTGEMLSECERRVKFV